MNDKFIDHEYTELLLYICLHLCIYGAEERLDMIASIHSSL